MIVIVVQIGLNGCIISLIGGLISLIGGQSRLISCLISIIVGLSSIIGGLISLICCLISLISGQRSAVRVISQCQLLMKKAGECLTDVTNRPSVAGIFVNNSFIQQLILSQSVRARDNNVSSVTS